MRKENISSPLTYLLLTLFLGPLGVHRFYRGQIGIGILYLLTGGVFFIGWIVDLINAILLFVNQKGNSSRVMQNNINSSPHSSSIFIPSRPAGTGQNSLNPAQYRTNNNIPHSNPKKGMQSSSSQPVGTGQNSPNPAQYRTNNNIPHSNPEKDTQDSISCPKKKDGCPLAYHYNGIPISDLNYDIAIQAANNHNWSLSAKKIDNGVFLYSDNNLIGSLVGKRAEMLSDWIVRNDPYMIFLENINTEQHTATVFLAFYRDKQKALSQNENSIFKLTHYRSEEAQLNITLLTEGTELELEEYDDEVSVSDIGKLPKKIAQRYIEEGASGCFFDHYDYDDEHDIYIPFVRIYW